MTGLFIFVGVALAVTIGAVALSARYRRFDSVTTFSEPGVVPLAEKSLIATPEEVTHEKISRLQHYDADDDLLDPHHSSPASQPPEGSASES